ncbi:Glutathione S-transferase [Aphelenchoides bicaudatus]|nr:Glutathione S-transferase [Aphelenchoides bicaudatus]
MPQYKIVYFPVRGLAEMSRLVLEYAKVPYEDERVEFEKWPALKEKTPFGQMPYLEVDGKVLAQSCAMVRYLARQHKLAGKDAFEEAQVDAVSDYHKDGNNQMAQHFGVIAGRVPGDKDAATKEVLTKVEERLPTYKKLLDQSGSGFFVKSGVTWVDFFIAESFVTLNNMVPNFFSKHSWVKDYVNRVHNLPQIKDYIAKRPKMPSYKLYYLYFKGLGEPIHVRLESFEAVAKLKDEFPYEKVPVLVIDGKERIAQQQSILRYLGKQYGLAGKNDLEAAYVDSLGGLSIDFFIKIRPFIRVVAGYETGDLQKLTVDYLIPGVLEFIPFFEKALAQSGSGFFAKSGLTWIDFCIKHCLTSSNNSLYWQLTAERIYALPTLKEVVYLQGDLQSLAPKKYTRRLSLSPKRNIKQFASKVLF